MTLWPIRSQLARPLRSAWTRRTRKARRASTPDPPWPGRLWIPQSPRPLINAIRRSSTTSASPSATAIRSVIRPGCSASPVFPMSAPAHPSWAAMTATVHRRRWRAGLRPVWRRRRLHLAPPSSPVRPRQLDEDALANAGAPCLKPGHATRTICRGRYVAPAADAFREAKGHGPAQLRKKRPDRAGTRRPDRIQRGGRTARVQRLAAGLTPRQGWRTSGNTEETSLTGIVAQPPSSR